MSELKAHVALFVDFESLARAGAAESLATLSQALVRYAGGVGRLMLARGYADFSERAADAKAVLAAHVTPVLVLPGPAGEDRAHVQLTVDALTSLYAGGEPDAVVIASADSRLLPLVQALRGDGSDVLFVSPSAAPVADVAAEADTVTTIEDVLGGAVGPASEPRADEEPDDAPAGADAATATTSATSTPAAPRVASAPPRVPSYGREARGGYRDDFGGGGRGPRSFASERLGGAYGGYGERRGQRGFGAPLDLSSYDWGSFVRLIDDLEHRLPFVGVRYLVNKVLGPRNCGIDDPRQKRDLINKAVDEGILEMYEVGNLEGRGDPVTACRLDRKNPTVVAVLGAETQTPSVPENRDAAAAMVEGGLPLDAGAGDGDPDEGVHPATADTESDDA